MTRKQYEAPRVQTLVMESCQMLAASPEPTKSPTARTQKLEEEEFSWE